MKLDAKPQATGPLPGSGASPISRAVAALKAADRTYAVLLRAIADAKPEGGMPADRLISLAASATGWDVGFLTRCTQVLSAMPLTWTAFDAGRISWSQVRGIVQAAKRLCVADRQAMDTRLTGAIDRNHHAEPDALVELAQSIAVHLTDQQTAEREHADDKAAFIRFQPRLDGGAAVDIVGLRPIRAASGLASSVRRRARGVCR